MPRLKKVEIAATVEKPVEKVSASKKRDPFEGLALEDCEPYTFNSSDLEAAEVIDRIDKGSDGVNRHTRTVFPGKPMFYLEECVRQTGNWFNLIGVYKKGVATGQKCIRTFKPKPRMELHGIDPRQSFRFASDRRDLEILKNKGIPVKVVHSAS